MNPIALLYPIIIATALLSSTRSEYNISVIHFNDFHSRYEPITNVSTTCKTENCIGGFSRLYWMTMKLMKERPNSILLNAGDNFKGSLWYIVHKWNVTQYFLNKLPLDAITLGNHEFDDGIEALLPFLHSIRAPVVVTNIDDTKEPRIQNLYQKSVIIERNGRKIGIIGVILTTTNLVSKTENLEFKDESLSVNAEAERLVRDEGVFTNIILSHCGYDVDLKIAKEANFKISLIVGGHTDTFLYTGTPIPGPDRPEGPYPTVITNKNGNKILVVQASAYTKYLGNLTVFYDDSGNVSSWEGAPIFLDHTIPTDVHIDKELKIWKNSVDFEGNKIIGEALFSMPNKPCRSEECLLGNFAADAMVYSYIKMADEKSWTYASVSMIHAGGMRAGIEKGNITYNELVTTFPFEDTIDVCEFKGKHIKEILESSVDDRRLNSPHFFQVSGIHVIFNTSKTQGDRVQSLKIRCRNCRTPLYENVDVEKYYRVILPGFLTNSAFNPLFKKYMKNKKNGDLDFNVYTNYLKKRSPIFQEIGGTDELDVENCRK